jgi:hypothetical protein
MNLHPILYPLLEEAKTAGRDALDKAQDGAKVAEFRYAYVETLIRGLDREGFVIMPKSSTAATGSAGLVQDARKRFSEELGRRLDELDTFEDVENGDVEILVRLNEVQDLLE